MSNYSPNPVAPPPPAKNSGCLKWGLLGCGALLVLGVGFVAFIVVVVFGAIKHSDVYREALRRAQNDPAVQAALGTPIQDGFMVSGSVNVDMQGGHANIDFPISGPKGKASVHAVATKAASNWTFSALKVTPDGGTPIDLRPDSGSAPSASPSPSSTDTTTSETTSSETSSTETGTGTTSSTST